MKYIVTLYQTYSFDVEAESPAEAEDKVRSEISEGTRDFEEGAYTDYWEAVPNDD